MNPIEIFEETSEQNVKYIHLENSKEETNDNIIFKNDIFEMLPEDTISKEITSTEEEINLKDEDIIQGSIEETPISSFKEITTEDILTEDILTEDILTEDILTEVNIDKKQQPDYKKMSLTKLRTIVLEKGLSNNISKLKKNELLQILESNLQN
jgi:hypothetical protein